MRIKNRMIITIGCIGLLAMSIPAFSLPSPKDHAHKQRIVLKKNVAQHGAKQHAAKPQATKGRANIRAARAVRESRVNRLTSTRITETPKRPLFGWPTLVSEARKYLGTNPTARSKLWCVTFMNMVLAKVGYAGTNSDAAKSFAQYGHRISEPEIGAIAVLSRGKNGGHVGVVSGIDKDGNPIIISGNHGHRVGEAIYPRSRVIAYVMPSDRGPGNTQFAERSQPANLSTRTTPDRGIESPIAELLAAIEAEQNRVEKPAPAVAQTRPAEPRQVVRQAPMPPAEPRRVVQQTAEPPRQMQRAGTLPLDPALANLLGIKDRGQARNIAPQPQQRMAPPERQRVVQRIAPAAAAARADARPTGAFSFR